METAFCLVTSTSGSSPDKRMPAQFFIIVILSSEQADTGVREKGH